MINKINFELDDDELSAFKDLVKKLELVRGETTTRCLTADQTRTTYL